METLERYGSWAINSPASIAFKYFIFGRRPPIMLKFLEYPAQDIYSERTPLQSRNIVCVIVNCPNPLPSCGHLDPVWLSSTLETRVTKANVNANAAKRDRECKMRVKPDLSCKRNCDECDNHTPKGRCITCCDILHILPYLTEFDTAWKSFSQF